MSTIDEFFNVYQRGRRFLRLWRPDRSSRDFRQVPERDPAHAHLANPPGHAERIEAHSRRVQAELERQGTPCRGERDCPQALHRRRGGRRAVVLRLLAGNPDGVERPSIGSLLGATKGSLDYLLNHPWFHTRRRPGPGGGNLPSIVTLTPAGRKAAERLAREEASHEKA